VPVLCGVVPQCWPKWWTGEPANFAARAPPRECAATSPHSTSSRSTFNYRPRCGARFSVPGRDSSRPSSQVNSSRSRQAKARHISGQINSKEPTLRTRCTSGVSQRLRAMGVADGGESTKRKAGRWPAPSRVARLVGDTNQSRGWRLVAGRPTRLPYDRLIS